MIKLYFLEWENGLIKAGFTYNGKRYLSLVTSQNRTRFVRSGAAITRNLEQYQLSEAQSAAVEAFMASGDFAVEYAAPIL